MRATLIGFALFFSTSSFAADKEVVLAADPWCPYTCDAGADPGFMVEAAEKILKEKGFKMVYKVMSWSRALEDTKSGVIDGALGAGGGDAADHLMVDPPMTSAQNCFYTSEKSNWKYDGAATLEKIILGVPQDYTFGDDALDTYIKKNQSNKKKIDAVAGEDILARNIKKLMIGRVDAIIDDVNVVAYYMKNNPADKLKQAGCLEADQTTIALSKAKPSSAEINKILSAGIKAMKDSGELAKIKAKYGMKD